MVGAVVGGFALGIVSQAAIQIVTKSTSTSPARRSWP